MTKMSQKQLNDFVDAAWEMNQKELYRYLSLAHMGNKDIIEAKKSMNLIMSAAANTRGAVATASITSFFDKGGDSIFSNIWKSIKTIICEIYTKDFPIQDKDLVTYLTGIIVAATNLTGAIAALVITIAVKKGLDKLCGKK